MIERAIENWLTNTTERIYQIPFCQVLQLEGHRVLYRSTHGILEQGKDIVTLTPKGDCYAYQLKTGDINLNKWRAIRGEILDLIQLPFTHPDVDNKSLHFSFLVANGEVKDPVLNEINSLNQDNLDKNRNFSRLSVINGRELLNLFIKAQGSFIPVEMADFESFLGFYLSDGKGQLYKNRFFKFLENVLFKNTPSQPSIAKNAVVSGVILTSYTLRQFQNNKNNFAQFEAWVCLAASIVRYANRLKLATEIYVESLELVKAEIIECLTQLHQEMIAKGNFLEGNIIGDGGILRGFRKIMVLGATSALQIYLIATQNDYKADQRLVELIKSNLPFDFLGECFFPHIYWTTRFLELCGENAIAISLLKQLTEFIIINNDPNGRVGLANPYYCPEDLLASFFNIRHGKEIDFASFNGSSYSLGPIVEMLVRRDQRNFLEGHWRKISHMEFLSFKPETEEDLLTFSCEKGVNITKFPKMTQSWSALKDDALSAKDIPEIVKSNIHLFLLYSLVCPHRINTSVVKAFDLML